MALKGKSTRTQTFAVIGDEHLAKSAEFVELKHEHRQLVAALASRSPATREILRAAKRKAVGLPLDLAEFYRRISRRGDHFLAPPRRAHVLADGESLP